MLSRTIFVSLLASSAMTLAIATSASAASTTDRAREAIAAAEAKIHMWTAPSPQGLSGSV